MAVESDFIGRKTVEMQMHSCTRKKKSLCNPSSTLSSLLYAFLSLNQNGIRLGNRNLIIPNSNLRVLPPSSKLHLLIACGVPRFIRVNRILRLVRATRQLDRTSPNRNPNLSLGCLQEKIKNEITTAIMISHV